MMGTCIFHIDVNSAFLSWEAVFRLKHLGGSLDLRQIPSAVGGDTAMRHGIILAKSLPAQKGYGIRTGESIFEARQKCQELYLVPPNYNLYERSSKAFLEIVRQYSEQVEQYSIDEAFVDMTGTETFFGPPEEAARKLKERIAGELGFTVNIGVSDRKVLAKMASGFRKPDQVHTLFSWEIREKLWPLPVSSLFFVGKATAGKLLGLGIKTIGELALTNPDILKTHLKKHGEVIWAFANGLDTSVVESTPPPNKGYGNSTTIPFDVADKETAKQVLLSLSETLAARLRKDRQRAGIVAVGIKDWEFHYASHQRILREATDVTLEIWQAATGLFDELWNGNPVRHLGIHTSRLQNRDEPRQMGMFDEAYREKQGKMDWAVDEIRRRYGMDAIKRGVFLSGTIDHMSGGISREKRRPDYGRLTID